MTKKGDHLEHQGKRKSVPPMCKEKQCVKLLKVSKDLHSDCKARSKALLDLEHDSQNYPSSSIESQLLVCKKHEFFPAKISKCEVTLPDKKPHILALPESQVLGKVKDFLGVISEANRKLNCDLKDHPEKYDIEALTGNESEFIEMDLMLGIADLHTPEAVAAAESAIAGHPPAISFTGNCSDDNDDDDNDEEEDNESNNCDSVDCEEEVSKAARTNSSSEASRAKHPKRVRKIVELS